jgi:hypothetical protein
VRLVHAEALWALGDEGGARAAIRKARSSLLAQACAMDDCQLRQCFLENVPENARTIALANLWGVGDEAHAINTCVPSASAAPPQVFELPGRDDTAR